MNTRGISPCLTLMFLFIQTATEIRNHVEIPTFQGSLCVYNAYAVYPFQEIMFFTAFVYFLRYFSLINLNETKTQIFEGDDQSSDLKRRFLLIKNRLYK